MTTTFTLVPEQRPSGKTVWKGLVRHGDRVTVHHFEGPVVEEIVGQFAASTGRDLVPEQFHRMAGPKEAWSAVVGG